MAEQVAKIEVNLDINDSDYTRGAQNAEKATEKLDKSVDELEKGLKKAGNEAKQAGKQLDDMGAHARKAGDAVSKLKSRISGIQSAIAPFAGFLGPLAALGSVGGIAAMSANAMQGNATAMQSMAVAAGGNAELQQSMQDLYRKINAESPISRESAGTIAATVKKRFPWLAETGQLDLGRNLAALGERGEDVGGIAQALEKLSKTYHGKDLQNLNAADLLNNLNANAAQAGVSVSSYASSLAALAPTAKKQRVSLSDLQQMMMAGSIDYGDTAEGSAARIAYGLSAPKRTDRTETSTQRIWDTQLHASFPGRYDVSGSLSPSSVTTPEMEIKRKADLALKNAGNFGGDVLTNLLGWIEEQHQAGLTRRAEWEQSGKYYRNINAYFTTPVDTPTVAMRHEQQKESYLWAQK